MTVQEIQTMIRQNMVLYRNVAKPLTDKEADLLIATWADALSDVFADPTVNLELDFENEQNRLAVLAALDTLKSQHRSILEQRYRYNRTLQEIADDRGVSRQCVNAQEKTALRNFKKALNMESLCYGP